MMNIPHRPRAGRGLALALALSVFAFTAGLLACRHGQTTDDLPTAALPDVVDYNFHIRPVLSDKCFKCHGPDAAKREAGLRLDTPEGAYAALQDDPTGHGIVPGNVAASEVYRRIITADTAETMPPLAANLPRVTRHEAALLEKWIQQGARYRPHWAFIPPKIGPLPAVKAADWPRHPIDRFTLARMEEQGLQPNPEADPERLLRRVSFDLTGLPPTPEAQQAFLNDKSPDAYEKAVDRLLKSPHYGERMALLWMDVARYADSHGYQDDGLRTMWPWRDWVIHAFNKNYSYRSFITYQLAGDLLPNAGKEQRLATGFNRNHKITQEGGVIDEEYRVSYVLDRTNTFGKALLALTFECAQCHDHKYDPISQKEYFSTFAFFNQVPEKGLFGVIDASFADPPNMPITNADVKGLLAFVNKKDTGALHVMVMKDTVRRPTFVLLRGNYDQHGEAVPFNMPKAILKYDSLRYGRNRLGLTRWLFDAGNPLTARVFVNRMWQEVFGRGLVKTTGDFGMQGELPTHPELLDWLAVDFRQHGYNIKRLMKQLVMTATYRQSATVSKEKLAADPENRWLARMSRLRLPAESIRDQVLAASGLLNPEIGGPSVKVYQPKGLWEVASSGRGSLKTYVQDHGSELYRRGLYVFIKRTVPPPTMLVFDASNRDQCEVGRIRTNTPLQALTMLNDPQVLEASRVLAERLVAEKTDAQAKINRAFQLIMSRRPTEKEAAALAAYLKRETAYFSERKKQAAEVLNVGEYRRNPAAPAVPTAALMQTIHVIFNLEEAIMKG